MFKICLFIYSAIFINYTAYMESDVTEFTSLINLVDTIYETNTIDFDVLKIRLKNNYVSEFTPLKNNYVPKYRPIKYNYDSEFNLIKKKIAYIYKYEVFHKLYIVNPRKYLQTYKHRSYIYKSPDLY